MGSGTHYPDWDGAERSFRYKGVGTSVEKVTLQSESESTTVGLRATVGQSSTPSLNTERRRLSEKKEAIVMFNPYVRYDLKNIGYGIGVHIGSSPARRLTAREEANRYLESRSVHFAPMLSLRLLPRDKFFLEGKLQDADPGSFPMMRTQFGGGIGFKANDQLGSIRAGLSDWGYYIESDVPVSDHIMLNGRFGFSREDENLIKSQNYLSLVMRYKP
jgi:hypothetical protein